MLYRVSAQRSCAALLVVVQGSLHFLYHVSWSLYPANGLLRPRINRLSLLREPKADMPVSNSYVFLRFCSLILVTIMSRLFEESYGGGYSDFGYGYGTLLDRVFFVVLFGAQLFNNIADVLLAVALIGVYLGLRHARSSEPPRYNKLIYRLCYGCVAFLVTVQVTIFIIGFFEAFSARDASHLIGGLVAWGYSFTGYEYWTVLYALGLLAAPIMCIAALTIFGLSISARKKTRSIPHLRRVSHATRVQKPNN